MDARQTTKSKDFYMGFIVGGSGMSVGVGISSWKPKPVSDYYAVLDNSGEEAIAVIAKADFNNRVEVTFGFEDDELSSLRIFNRWASERISPCKGITKAEYETYIEFGIPDMGIEISWNKWLKSILKNWKNGRSRN